MLTPLRHLHVTPTPSLLNSLSAAQWIENTSSGHVGFLLLTHPLSHSPASLVEARMRSLADELGLAPSAEQMPTLGDRLSVSETHLRLRLAPSGLTLRVAIPNPEWARFALAHGPVAVIVGLDPLESTGKPAVINHYLALLALTDRLLLGKALHSHAAEGEYDA
ncbi:hypothetical protein [Streptomyces sp. NPDC001205]